MPCAMCGKYSSVWITFTFTPAACTGGIQSGTPAMPTDLPVATNSHTPVGTDRLDVDVVLGEPHAREQPKQRVERGVLKRHHGDGLALEIGRLLDAGILAHHELHETLAAEHGDDFHRHPVAPHHDRSVRHDAAERRITGADLLCYVDAAAADGEAHVEAGLR